MATFKPKISLYVPNQVYTQFKEFQLNNELSMSAAGTVIIAEYFGLEETIKNNCNDKKIGGITLTRIQKIESRLCKLEELIEF